MLAADQMPLNQYLFLQRGKVLQQFGKRLLHFRKFFYVRLDQFQNRSALGFLRPTGKSAVAQITREPDAAADYDLMMRSLATEPFSGVRHDIRKFHGVKSSIRFRVA